MFTNPFEVKEVKSLKELIEEKYKSQRNFAKVTGLKERTINSWVSGQYTPSLENAVIVAKALDIDLETLAKSLGLDVTGLPNDSMTSQ